MSCVCDQLSRNRTQKPKILRFLATHSHVKKGPARWYNINPKLFFEPSEDPSEQVYLLGVVIYVIRGGFNVEAVKTALYVPYIPVPMYNTCRMTISYQYVRTSTYVHLDDAPRLGMHRHAECASTNDVHTLLYKCIYN